MVCVMCVYICICVCTSHAPVSSFGILKQYLQPGYDSPVRNANYMQNNAKYIYIYNIYIYIYIYIYISFEKPILVDN